MSGTLSSIYNNSVLALSTHARELLVLQEQVSSGSRINRASDEPSAAYRVLNLNSQKRSIENYLDNLSEVSDVLEFASTAVDDIKSALADAKTLLGDVTGGTGGGVGVNVTIEGLNDAIDRIIAAANVKHSGKYIFGGTDTSTQPFAVTRVDGQITSVTYQGSAHSREVEVASGVDALSYYVGSELFQNDNRSEPVFTGQTGAAAGTGTSSVTGDVWFTVTENAGSYWISINGGTEVIVPPGGDTNQMVTDPETGKVLYVDTTGINATGTEWVRVPGTYNVFDALIAIRDRLASETELTSAEMEELRSNTFETVDELSGLLVQKSVAIGSKIGFLDNVKNNLENLKYGTEDEVTRIEEADIAQLAIDLSRREVLYQMSLSVAGKLLSTSLLDYI
ncbi:MAG: flagellar hook-associated protein FlgL [Phycisphaerales bacterium]|jgi:flagellar hook-associated protein 3 FlgL